MSKEFIVLQGIEYTIEWYFNERGKSIALEYFEELPLDRQKKAFGLFKFMADIGKIYNDQKFTHEGDKIYAFKPMPDRFFCFFFEGSKIIITNAYEKKTQKMSPGEKERAMKARQDYLQRVKQGCYYE